MVDTHTNRNGKTRARVHLIGPNNGSFIVEKGDEDIKQQNIVYTLPENMLIEFLAYFFELECSIGVFLTVSPCAPGVFGDRPTESAYRKRRVTISAPTSTWQSLLNASVEDGVLAISKWSRYREKEVPA